MLNIVKFSKHLMPDSPVQCLLMTLPGWIIAFITESWLMADIAAVANCILTITWLVGRLGSPVEMVRFARLGGIVLSMTQSTAWLTASWLHRFQLHISIMDSLQDLMFGVTLRGYMLALINVSCFCVALSGFGSHRSFLASEKVLAEKLLSLLRTKVDAIVFVLVAFNLFLIVSGVLGQRSMIVEGYGEGKAPFWMFVIDPMNGLQAILNPLMLVQLIRGRNQGGFSIFRFSLAILSVAVSMFVSFNDGRGALVGNVVIHAWWFIFFSGRSVPLLRMALIGMIFYPILSEALLLSNFIRSTSAGFGDMKRGSAIDIVPEAYRRMKASEDLMKAEAERSMINLSKRPLVAGVLASCLELPAERKHFVLEKDLVHSLIWTIPGPLFPSKDQYPVQEALLYANFPVGEKDTADSPYLYAYVSFGWLGVVIYPFLLVLGWWGVLWLVGMQSLRGYFAAITGVIWFRIFLLGLGENSTIAIIGTLRTTLALWVMFYLYSFVFGTAKSQKIKDDRQAVGR